jgi:hypothetical protein
MESWNPAGNKITAVGIPSHVSLSGQFLAIQFYIFCIGLFDIKLTGTEKMLWHRLQQK